MISHCFTFYSIYLLFSIKLLMFDSYEFYVFISIVSLLMEFQAYLSLPDGTATVAGLIAMMTDHYNILVR